MKNSQHIVSENAPVREALQRLSALPDMTALVLFAIAEDGKMTGALTDGDIRRGLISGKDLEDPIHHFMFRNFKFFNHNQVDPFLIKQYRELGIWLVPVLSFEGTIVDVFDLKRQKTQLPFEVMLMAGGRGERLRPLTDHIPKPLLPVNGKPIIDYNLDWLVYHGIKRVNVSVRYLANQIQEHIKQKYSQTLDLKFIHEEAPLGTIGCLSQVEYFGSDTLLLLNSDLLTNIDLEDFYFHFINHESDLSIASIPYRVNIPYAVLELHDNKVTGLIEKPNYTFLSNAGIYLLKTNLIKPFIPAGQFYNATDFIDALIGSGKKVSAYANLQYWLDIGKPEDYAKAQEEARHLNFK